MITARWFAIGLAAAFVVGCGSSSDGGDDSGSTPPPVDVVVLPIYDYTLVSVPEDPITVNAPVGDDGNVTLILGNTDILGEPTDPSTVFGSYTLDDGTFTIAEGSQVFVGDGDPGNFDMYEDFQLDVTATWIFPPDGPPIQGAFELLGAFRMINVEVTPEGLLSLTYTDVTPITDEVVLSFEELDEAADDPDAPFWLEWGVFAYQFFSDLMPELASYGVAGFDLIVDELADASPVTVACDAFSSIGLTVPWLPSAPILPDEGSITFTWLDDAADGLVGPGDSFDMGWEFCLAVVEPVTDEQIALNGLVSLNSYTEVIQNNTLARIGFEGVSPADRPGGLNFDDLRRYEVYDADGPGGSNVAMVHLGATINGRMTLVFTEPAD